jgi:hypothetical protein
MSVTKVCEYYIHLVSVKILNVSRNDGLTQELPLISAVDWGLSPVSPDRTDRGPDLSMGSDCDHQTN